MAIPHSLLLFVVTIFFALVGIFYYSYYYNSKQRGTWRLPSTFSFASPASAVTTNGAMGHYTSIPDVDVGNGYDEGIGENSYQYQHK
jgi:hypothetical protein